MTGQRMLNRCGGVLAITGVITLGGAAASEGPVHDVQVVASNFAYEPSTIQVPGERIHLVIRSREGTHGFSIPKLKINVRVARTSEPVVVEFTTPGQYEIACSEFCGSGHGQMKAALISMASVTATR
jgi:cytochrome c oxidase subunit II